MNYYFKDNYLDELRKALNEFRISNKEIDEIVADYDSMYDEAKAIGYSDEDIYQRLGNPRNVAKELSGTFVENINPYSKKHRKNFLISTSPMVAIILFLLLGFLWGYWHPGWLAFLWIPISSILFGSKKSFLAKLSSLSVFMALIAFIVLGYFNYWHPGWLVWLLVPLCGTINSSHYSSTDDKKWLVIDTTTNDHRYFKTHHEATKYANQILNSGHSVKIEKII